MSDKFLKLVEENTPGYEDRTPEEQAKVHVTSILKKAGYEADYKTFKDEITVALGDGTKVVLEVKKVIPAESEEVDAVEDQEMRVDDEKVEQAQKALKAAEAITGTKEARAGMLGRDPKKNVERAVGKLYNKVAKQLNQFTKEF